MAVNQKGDYFPVWGTCMGMQLMSIMTADDYSVLTHGTFKTEGVSLPLEFDPVTVCWFIPPILLLFFPPPPR